MQVWSIVLNWIRINVVRVCVVVIDEGSEEGMVWLKVGTIDKWKLMFIGAGDEERKVQKKEQYRNPYWYRMMASDVVVEQWDVEDDRGLAVELWE